MKRTLLTIITVFCAFAAHSQSAVCKRFLSSEQIQTYCVDNYPLGNDDSINVTFLVATESRFYDTIRLFLSSLPKAKNRSETSISIGGSKLEAKNSFIIRYSESLSGDKGHYLTFLSSCNMTAMIFHIRNEEDMKKVISHVLAKEMKSK